MTRHVGSRASGYPPDFVSFRRRAGALVRWCSAPTSIAGAISPSIALWERCSGSPRSRAGAPTGAKYPDRRKHEMTESSADARDPPTGFNRGLVVLNGLAPNSRSIVGDRATHVCRFDKTAILSSDFRVLDFGEFSKVENRALAIFNDGRTAKRRSPGMWRRPRPPYCAESQTITPAT
jgi:hypothetical protein